ncbi:MAG: GntR family transcriptional regulator [Acidimicrobiales bacterium]
MPLDNLEPVARRATSTIIAETIRERIMDGTFEPGMQLTEAQLADRLAVSRGPVREAFQRLLQEGLIEAAPHRGVFVTTLDAADAADIALARVTIERAAAARVARRGDSATLDGLQALVDEMDAAATTGRWSDVADIDLRFHEALVAGADSPRLRRMYATLLVETRLCLQTLPAQHRDPTEVVTEHRGLLAALAEGDVDAAGARIEAHLAPANPELTA